MSYLGQVELKSSEIRRIDVTGSTSATHTLTWTPASEQSLIITINGIKQQNNYSISGVTLTLDDALLSADKMEVVGILDIGEATIPPDDSITTAMVKDDAVTADKLANAINTDIAANTAKVTNATHTGDVTGATALTIATDAVDIAMLSATGSASSSTFLRGDNSWQTAGVSTLAALTDATVSSSDPTISSNPAAVGHLWINSTSGESYICSDISTGANVWKNIGDGTGGVDPFEGMVATGGTITTDGDYKVHTFNTGATFTVTTLGSDAAVEYLVIGAGGGGGRGSYVDPRGAGGGGAGGYRANTAYDFTVTASAYTITIGAGGAGGTGSSAGSVVGTDGTTSTFSTIDSGYGGGGGGHSTTAGQDGRAGSGGSGGGGSNGNVGGGSGSYGNDGAAGDSYLSGFQGGGGGGAGAVGTLGASGGDGGAGTSNDITGASVCRAGGGGGGGSYHSSATCGGGDGGAIGDIGNVGTANTGGGGGGENAANGYAGGSGVVIIRYKFQ